MPKSRRKVEVDRDLLRRFLELQRESRETDRKLAEVLADIRLLRKQIREGARLR
jgi:hypothetical protein